MEATEPNYTITALDRAFDILQALAEHPGASLTELARITGYTNSLVFRMIHTMEKRGFVEKNIDGGSYTLGYQPLFLSARAEDQIPLLQYARQFVEELSDRTDQSVNLMVRESLHHLTVLSKDPTDPKHLYARPGRRGPLYIGGAPKVLLAFAPANIQSAVLTRPMYSPINNTILDPADIAKQLEMIRITGYNESRGELDIDGFSFAAVIYRRDGSAVAAVSLAGRAGEIDPKSRDFYRDGVMDAAKRISERLGWSKWRNVA